MSTDIVCPELTLALAHKHLREAKAAAAEAVAKQQQAEEAQHLAEEQARRAEERATIAEADRDGWAAFAHALTNYHLIDQYATDKLTDDDRLFITEELYEEWSTGTKVWDLNAETLVNGAEGR